MSVPGSILFCKFTFVSTQQHYGRNNNDIEIHILCMAHYKMTFPKYGSSDVTFSCNGVVMIMVLNN